MEGLSDSLQIVYWSSHTFMYKGPKKQGLGKQKYFSFNITINLIILEKT